MDKHYLNRLIEQLFIRTATLVTLLAISTVVFSQAPEKMSYQAIVRDANGNYIEEFSTNKIRQVISEKTSKRVIEMMKVAVSDGTGGEASLPNVVVAGKTGTYILFNRGE